MDYKSTTRVRTKVPKSLARRPGSSKPLTIWGLDLSAAILGRNPGAYGVRSRGVGRQAPSLGTRSLTPNACNWMPGLLCLQSSDVVNQIRNPLLHLSLMPLANA
jgi:hypothetical protein